MIYAPVIICTLCRYEHLKRCIGSLGNNSLAECTVLYIGLDYPSKEEHWEGYNKILKYLPSISGFKQVEIIKRETNFGTIKNYRTLREKVMQSHDRFIVSEDDNEFSPNFLKYTNQALEKYKDNENIFAVCGYTLDLDLKEKEYINNIFVSSKYIAWGAAYWSYKYEKYYPYYVNFNFLNMVIKNSSFCFNLLNTRPHVLNHVMTQLAKGVLFTDCIFECMLLLEKKYCIFPSISKIRNWGHDGSGVNCKKINDKSFINNIFDQNNDFNIEDIELTEKNIIYKTLKKKEKKNILYKFLTLSRYIMFRLLSFDFWHMKFVNYL